MFACRNFFVFVPLSNWIRGFDRYRQHFDKANLPRSRFPGEFYVLADDAPQDHVRAVLEKSRALIARLAVSGDRLVRLECRLPTEPGAPGGLYAQPNTFTGTGVGWRWPSPRLPINGYALLDDQDNPLPVPHEAITAAAFALPNSDLVPWQACSPRSFSVLPIARACNANCAFCFSRASVSDAVVPHRLDLDTVARWSALAASRGARRAVITGGGEPTLLRPSVMEALVSTLARNFDSVLLITNASRLIPDQRQDTGHVRTMLEGWRQAGLTRIAISRHGVDATTDAALMGLAVDVPAALEMIHAAGIQSRLICVMQKRGVQTVDGVAAYLDRAATEGVSQVCFKELYVSSLSENPWASSKENQYCQANQVPLSMLLEAMDTLGFQKAYELPWGSPVYVGQANGVSMQVAAYTEPSVGWERQHGVVRSWNLMADGACLASLEDPASRLAFASPNGQNVRSLSPAHCAEQS